MSREELLGKKFEVLNHGYVILRDVMGSDEDIERAARISYQTGTREVSKTAALIDRLMRDRHTSPFELPVLQFQVKLPIFVERQWVRHRTCSMNEMSGRYSVMPEEYYVPAEDVIRAQSKTNKQGREDGLSEDVVKAFINRVAEQGREAFKGYGVSTGEDLARELARITLPLGTYTEKVWQMNLHNLLHFLKLRTDSHAQWEIRQYAEVIEGIVAQLFPLTHKSWENHIKYAVSFSMVETAILREALNGSKDLSIVDLIKGSTQLTESQKREFLQKLS